MKKTLLLLSFLCLFFANLSAQVTEVNYRIVFNEVNEEYDCYVHIVAGSATSIIERAQFTSAFVLVTPKELTIDNINSISPSVNTWAMSQTILEPANNPNFNYYQVLATFTNPDGFHNNLSPGDSVHLFSATASHNMHGPDGIRTLITSDNQPITNNFQLGNFPSMTPGILPQGAPTVYAEHFPLDLPIGTSNTLTPDDSQGSWANSDPTVVTLVGDVITADAVGSAILTYTPNSGVPSSTIARAVTADPLSEVDYLIEFNETDCAYDCKFIVNQGVAVDPADRIQFNSTYSLVVPSDVTISNSDISNEAPTGVSWAILAAELSPPSDPDHNFYHILSDNPTAAMHDTLVPGDTVTLFQVQLPYDFHGQVGIRNFINGSDLVGNPVNMDNSMIIGDVLTELYNTNRSTTLPTVFAELSGSAMLLVGETSTLTPGTSNYSSSDVSVATVSGNTVTAVGPGTTIITYSPATGCSSDILLTVENNAPLDDVKYEIRFDESTCLYDCYIIAENGNALTQNERLKLASTYSIAIPKDVNIVAIHSVAPSSDSWEVGDSVIAAPADSLMKFYQIHTTLSGPPEFYDPIYQGDEVLLFSVEVDANVFGQCGFRNYVNGQDPTGDTYSIDNDFNIGAQNGILSGILPFVEPTGVATAANSIIDIGQSTTVSPGPGSGGTWATNGSSAAVFDSVTNTVTGYEQGSILLTYDDGQGCQSSVVVKVANPVHDPVSEVDYLMKFNETTCEYDCYVKIITGSALTQLERTLFGASFTIVTPTETSLNFEESVSPAGGTNWYISQTEIAPVNDPEHNYYNMIVNVPSGTFDFLEPNDEVLLFSISTDDNLHGPEGIRLFDNATDPANVVNSLHNQFNLGEPVDDFQGNLPVEFPAVFAESPNGSAINTSMSTQLTPSTGGTWTSSDLNVVQVTTDGLATAYGDGSAVLTYDPDDINVCSSSVVLDVTTLPHDQVTEIDYQLKFNETTCEYDAYFEVITGSALTITERILFGASFTVKVPIEITVQLEESVNPSATTWILNQEELSPANDPEFNYYHFTSTSNPTDRFDFLNPGDEVHLFSISTSSTIHNDDRIRIFDNVADMGNPVNAMQNEFNLGEVADDYQSNKAPELPTVYTEITIDSIFVSQTTTATSTIAGTWSSNDVSIATVDPNTGVVTGVGLGTAIITLTPDVMNTCSSSALVHVVQHEPLSEISYQLVWDENTDEYIAYLIAEKGNAITQNERLKLASTYSIVTPDLVTPTISSTTPSTTSWQIVEQILAPASDPLHNFYQVSSPLSGPPEFYDIILEGDQVELFRISLDYNVHGVNGLRIFDNDLDIPSNTVDLSNDFNIGPTMGIFENVENTIPPALFADTDVAYEIVVGTTTNALPTSGGTWSNSDASIATRDANGLITGLAVGTTIFTFTPDNNVDAPSSIIIYVLPDQNSTINAVEFKVEQDANVCGLYNCYMVITDGSAYNPLNLFQSNATYTIKTPSDVTISLNESINPATNTWTNGNSLLAPTQDPTHNFFSFHPTLNGAMYDPLVEGQEVLLFTVNATSSVQGPKGIVLFDNDNDLPNNPLSFLNGTTIGSTTQIYDGNQPGEGIGDYAEAIGPTVIVVGGQTTIIPNMGGTWSNSNPSVASLDGDIVTGLSLGTTLLTFTPTDISLCPSSLAISVEPESTSVAGVTVGTVVLSPSAIFEVYSTEKGILIPRMTQEQRLCIASPADGLLVFQLDQENGFYYFNGSSWTRLDDVISNGTSNLNNNETSAAMQADYNELIKMLQTQQNELEQKLTEQEALIIKLQEIIDNQ